MKGPKRIASLLVMAALAAGCSATFRNHGYAPADDELAAIAVGQATKSDVADAVGRPVATGVLSESGWYYVESRYRDFAYRAPREIDREVVAISFNDADVVTNIERFGLERGRVVVLSRRVTESNVQDVGFLRQLFGNLGNFDLGDFVESQ